MNEKGQSAKFIWKVTYAHTIAYAIAGMTMMNLMNYEEIWAMEVMSFYRPIDGSSVESIVFKGVK